MGSKDRMAEQAFTFVYADISRRVCQAQINVVPPQTPHGEPPLPCSVPNSLPIR